EVARRQLCLELDNSVVIDNPPSFDDLSCLPFPKSDVSRLASIGRLECRVKGQDVLLQALAHPRWKDRKWRLSLVGAGPDRDYLEELIAFLGLREKVDVLGYRSDIRGVWGDHSLLIMCSHGEGKPLALTEAMVCGRPAVVSNVGGNAELIEDG